MLRVKNLSVVAGRNTILSDVNLQASLGRVNAIVGPNGSGKSTLLKAMTGELPFSGQIELNALDVAKALPWQLSDQRAVLSQATPLSFPFQVIEIVRLGTQGHQIDADRLAQEALYDVGLGGYENRLYQELSGGEQQRAQLARVLCQARAPGTPMSNRWLFLDEPVASLDIAHQLQVMQIARDFADQGGGVVVVMHDLNLTAMFADLVIVMAKGRLHSIGTVEDALTSDTLSTVYGCPVRPQQTPAGQGWFMLPQAAGI